MPEIAELACYYINAHRINIPTHDSLIFVVEADIAGGKRAERIVFFIRGYRVQNIVDECCGKSVSFGCVNS